MINPLIPLSALMPRQNSSPCPNANGTIIGDVQQFRLFCSSDIQGQTLTSMNAAGLPACVELCSSFHPRCTGVTYSADGTCNLKSNVDSSQVRSSTQVDGAIGLGASVQPASDCSSLGSTTTIGGMQFALSCNRIANGKDMQQMHTSSMQECLASCSKQSGCNGVSYDASMNLGFKNCYLKTNLQQGDIFDDTGIDTALLNAGNPAGTITVTAGVPTGTSTGPSFSITGFTTLRSAPDVVTVTPGLSSGVRSSTAATATAGEIDQSSNGSTNASDAAATSPSSLAGSDNLAWIAAPVVGGIAAVLLVVVMFVLWGRKRKRRDGGRHRRRDRYDDGPRSPGTPMTPWVPPFIGNYWRAWSSGKDREREKGRGTVRLESPPASRGKGIARREKGVSAYEVRNGRVELRDSVNGLRLNSVVGEIGRAA